MSFKQRIEAIRHFYGIFELADWQKLTTAQVLKVPNVGPETLEHLQMYLAAHKIALKDSPGWEFWTKQSGTRIAQVLSEVDVRQRLPFVVLIDNQEKRPFSFASMRILKTQLSRDVRRMIDNEEIECAYWDVPRKHVSLGKSRGDYSILGLEGRCHWERKSVGDCIGTVLGNQVRRLRFEAELAFLNRCIQPAVFIEGTFPETLAAIGDTEYRPAADRRNSFINQIISWKGQFPNVHWEFAGSRAFAELLLFRTMFRCWRKQEGEIKKEQLKSEKDAMQMVLELGI